jgi:hypothetical protein
MGSAVTSGCAGGRSRFSAVCCLAHIVDELDPRVGSQFSQENVIGGVLGVEDYSIAPLCIIDA